MWQKNKKIEKEEDYVKKEITTRYLGMGVSFRYA